MSPFFRSHYTGRNPSRTLHYLLLFCLFIVDGAPLSHFYVFLSMSTSGSLQRPLRFLARHMEPVRRTWRGPRRGSVSTRLLVTEGREEKPIGSWHVPIRKWQLSRVTRIVGQHCTWLLFGSFTRWATLLVTGIWENERRFDQSFIAFVIGTNSTGTWHARLVRCAVLANIGWWKPWTWICGRCYSS